MWELARINEVLKKEMQRRTSTELLNEILLNGQVNILDLLEINDKENSRNES